MAKSDWLVGQDRNAAAAERIYSSASDIVSRKGFDALTIDALAQKVHCSTATIYRHVGGKTAVVEAVTVRLSRQILQAVRVAIADLDGVDRVVTAVVVAPSPSMMTKQTQRSKPSETFFRRGFIFLAVYPEAHVS